MAPLSWATALLLAAVAVATPCACQALEGSAQKSDAELLLAFKSSFSNGARLGWRGSQPCEWARVKCSGGRVTELLLEDKGLVGSIPPGGWALPDSLLNLDLDGCRLSGSIPQDFVLPEGLVKLELDRNSLTGGIPAGWKLPGGLQELHLYSNRLSSSLPREWVLPASLRALGLNGNLLTALPSCTPPPYPMPPPPTKPPAAEAGQMAVPGAGSGGLHHNLPSEGIVELL